MYYTGFADEVSQNIDDQIRATLALGWKSIEMRGVSGKNLTELSDAEFDAVCQKTAAAGITVNSFGSAIANGRNVKPGEDEFATAIAEMKRALPRMKRMGSKMIRGMSFKLPGPGDHFGSTYEKSVLSTIRTLAQLCADAGVVYVHENCSGYGSLSPEHTLRLVAAAASPGFGLVFDTGNPVGSSWVKGEQPWGPLGSWDFYEKVKEHVVYFHMKDALMAAPAKNAGEEVHPGGYVASREAAAASGKAPEKVKVHVFPGEGEGDVKKILADLFKRGYDGGISIEPHVKPEQYTRRPFPFPAESERFNMYVDYGRAAKALVESIKR